MVTDFKNKLERAFFVYFLNFKKLQIIYTEINEGVEHKLNSHEINVTAIHFQHKWGYAVFQGHRQQGCERCSKSR